MLIEQISESNMNIIPAYIEVNIIGKVELTYNAIEWTDKILYYKKASVTSFPTSKPANINDLSNDRFGYIYTNEGEYVGHAIVEKRFNNTLYIEDFDVAAKYRKSGCADKLMDNIIAQNKDKFCGISLEVQHTNVIAYLFYKRCGFKVGGLDTLFYDKTQQCGEHAIYMYCFFEK